MKKKYPAHIEQRALLHSIAPVDGWVLITREESDPDTGEKAGPWGIAWHDVFGTKKAALAFAKENSWWPPYRAVRGSLAVAVQPPKRR